MPQCVTASVSSSVSEPESDSVASVSFLCLFFVSVCVCVLMCVCVCEFYYLTVVSVFGVLDPSNPSPVWTTKPLDLEIMDHKEAIFLGKCVVGRSR